MATTEKGNSRFLREPVRLESSPAMCTLGECCYLATMQGRQGLEGNKSCYLRVTLVTSARPSCLLPSSAAAAPPHLGAV